MSIAHNRLKKTKVNSKAIKFQDDKSGSQSGGGDL